MGLNLFWVAPLQATLHTRVIFPKNKLVTLFPYFKLPLPAPSPRIKVKLFLKKYRNFVSYRSRDHLRQLPVTKQMPLPQIRLGSQVMGYKNLHFHKISRQFCLKWYLKTTALHFSHTKLSPTLPCLEHFSLPYPQDNICSLAQISPPLWSLWPIPQVTGCSLLYASTVLCSSFT